MGRKIGIITHWDIPNYGTFLQAYGMQRSLSELFPDDDIYLVAYMNKKHKKAYYSLERHEEYRYWLINPFFYLDILGRIKYYSQIMTMRKFHDYYLEYTKHTKELNESELIKEQFDIVILGSDILWDYSISIFGNDKHMFGGGLNAKKIISYAASFGTVKVGMDHPEYVKSCIKKLDAIAVREEKSANIIREFSDKEVVQTVDPTWLWDFNNDPNVVESPIVDRYIIVYGGEFPQNMIDEAIAYAKENNYKIVYLDGGREKCDWCDIFVKSGDITPFEWCGYIKGAEIVMTCAFHGLMFSLIYKKKIVFYATQFMLDKAQDIIKQLDLKDILIDAKSFNAAVEYSWDYVAIYKKIDRLKEQSIDYLIANMK